MRAIALACVSAAALAGCLDFQPGSPTGPTDGGTQQHPGAADLATANNNPQPGPTDMATPPGADLTPAPLGTELCEATLSLAGTFVQGDAPPTDFPGGCWPDGTWTFTATVTQNGCSSAPQLESQYQFKVVEDADYNDTITYLNDPSNMYVATKISGGEGAVCTGAFMIYSSDGKTVINLRPAMQADNSINGQGDYRVYDADQRF
jgi:hypothetical protein